MTSLAEERVAQKVWHARSRGGDLGEFDRYLENEFADPDVQRAAMSERLARILQFAASNVPFYREALRSGCVDAQDPDGLATLSRLKILSKHDVQNNAESLCADKLPQGYALAPPSSSSGTTGRRTVVQRSTSTTDVLVYQKQREHRWFRFDPAARLAYIRFAHHFSPKPDGAFPKDGEAVSEPAWPHIGRYFSTGPHFTFNVTSPVEQQLKFLRQLKPDYLMSYAETLEHLTFSAGGARPSDSLKGLVSISEQLTPGMRRRIESSFGAPIRQNYGLNEIGLVAVECEAGRFHVHTEHCWVEIVDEFGAPAAPGETGRLLVSSLNNMAMPLFRYDTGDLATASDGSCPCGRTLPSFAAIAGRYSRIAFLPEGTLTLVGLLREAVETGDETALAGVRLFQIHQGRDRNFELRVVSAKPPPQSFVQVLADAWKASPAAKGLSLRIVRVDSLARSQGGKFQVFTSDFMPVPDQP